MRAGGSAAVARRRLLAAVGLALFGLLTMHGWGVHVGSHGSDPMMNGPAMTGSVGASTEGTTPSVSPTAHAAPAADAAQESPTGHMSAMGLMGLCLAVLAIAAVLLVRLARLWRRAPLLRVLDPVRATAIRVRSRDPDPPDLLRLCVIRC